MTGEELKLKRKVMDLTQDQLADLLGVTRITIIRWEKEEEIPKFATLALKQIESERNKK